MTGILGTTRVRKGMLGSLPSGLLTPTVPCCSMQSIHRELCVTGIELKRINDQKIVRLRMILFEMREVIEKKEPKEMD